MRKRPIKIAGLAVEWPHRQRALVDPGRRRNLGVVPGRKYLVRAFEIRVAQARLDHRDAGAAQQIDDALARDAIEERPVRRRREHGAIPRHEDIGCGELRDIAEHVADEAIVEAARARLEQSPRAVWIKAAGLGVDRHRLRRRTTEGRQRNRKAFRLWHWHFVEGEAPLRRFRIGRDREPAVLLRPVHGTDVEFGSFVEALQPVFDEADPCLGRNLRLQIKRRAPIC